MVDLACFVGHDSSGPKQAKCAEACARAGNPLATYDEATKTLYLAVSLDHKNPNAKLMDFIEKKVKVSGRVMEKAGIKGIAIEKVEATFTATVQTPDITAQKCTIGVLAGTGIRRRFLKRWPAPIPSRKRCL